MRQHLHTTNHSDNCGELFRRVECECWAPWLRFEPKHFAVHQELFPEGQFRLFGDDGLPYAALSCSRIEWDEVIGHLPSWDSIAGQSFSFAEGFANDGNALVAMSMSVRRDRMGQGVARELMKSAIERSAELGVSYVIADLRPTEYGRAKRKAFLEFSSYVALRREDGTRLDPWLRLVEGLGFQLCKIDATAMVIKASRDDIDRWMREYNPGSWWQVCNPSAAQQLVNSHAPGTVLPEVAEIWECGETGTWYLADDRGAYIESNLWGVLPRKSAGQ